MFDAATVDTITRVAKKHDLPPAALLAIVEVESAGRTHALVDGRKEPVIRFEGHWFDDRLKGVARTRARRAGLAHPSVGGVKNPRSQAARWRLLARAMEIDAAAALESTSFGVGQVMGGNWKSLGFSSVHELVALARSGVAGQVELMLRFIRVKRLMDEIKRRDWAGFARVYNGPAYARNRYDVKMARAYARYNGARVPNPASGMLRVGSSGQKVRELQVLLRRSGFDPGAIDGDFGPATRDAVRSFQAARGLTVDGVVGPETQGALARFRQSTDERPGAVPVTKDTDVGVGVGVGVGGGAALETAKRTVDETLQNTGYALPDQVVVALTILSVGLALGGLAWAGWRIWQKRRTRTGMEGYAS